MTTSSRRDRDCCTSLLYSQLSGASLGQGNPADQQFCGSGWRDLNPRPLRPEQGPATALACDAVSFPGHRVGLCWPRWFLVGLIFKIVSQISPECGRVV